MTEIDELLAKVADKRAEGLDAARPQMVEKAEVPAIRSGPLKRSPSWARPTV